MEESVTDIRILDTKAAKKKAALHLGLTLERFEAGLGDISHMKYPAIDIDTIIPKLDAAEAAASEAQRKQLVEAHEKWQEEMVRLNALIHKASKQDGMPLCWTGKIKSEQEPKISKKIDEVTCKDCSALFSVMSE